MKELVMLGMDRPGRLGTELLWGEGKQDDGGDGEGRREESAL